MGRREARHVRAGTPPQVTYAGGANLCARARMQGGRGWGFRDEHDLGLPCMHAQFKQGEIIVHCCNGFVDGGAELDHACGQIFMWPTPQAPLTAPEHTREGGGGKQGEERWEAKGERGSMGEKGGRQPRRTEGVASGKGVRSDGFP